MIDVDVQATQSRGHPLPSAKDHESRAAWQARCRARLETLSRKIREPNANVTAEELERYQQLSELVATFGTARRFRVEACVILGVTLLVPLLFMTRMTTSEIEIQARVRSFAATAEGLGELDLDALDKWGALAIGRPPNLQLSAACAIPEHARRLMFTLGDKTKRRPFALEPLELRPADRFSLLVRNRSIAIDQIRPATLPRPLAVSGRAQAPLQVFFEPAAPAASDLDELACFTTDWLQASYDTELSLTVAQLRLEHSAELVEIPFRIGKPAFDALQVAGEEVDRHQNWGIQEGSLVLRDLGGKRLDLTPGDPLIVDFLDGEMRSLALRGDYLDLNLRGTATLMKVGRHRRDVMPRRFEWLRAQEPAIFYAGAVAALWGVLVALRRLSRGVMVS